MILKSPEKHVFFSLFYSINISRAAQLGFGVQSCQVLGGANLWVVLFDQSIYMIENAVPHFPSLSQTPPL